MYRSSLPLLALLALEACLPALPDDPKDVAGDSDADADSDTDTDTDTGALDADGDGFTVADGDCDDSDATIFPGATELCDGFDQDCDQVVDDGELTTFYGDVDGDGFGDAGWTVDACELPVGYATNSDDCDDGDPSLNPDAVETCDGVDTNCSGDEGDTVDPSPWYADVDGDGYGDTSAVTTSCTAPAGYVVDDTDCDDGDRAVSPGGTETCENGVDDDCDGGAGACAVGDRSLAVADAQYTGEAVGDYAGYAVSGAGDVDDDGYDDLIISAYDNDDGGSRAGAAYLLLGSAAPVSLGLSSADAQYTGTSADDLAGAAVSGAGDVDADGYDDVVIGAYDSNVGGSRAGSAYLVLGGATPRSLSLSSASAQYTGEATDDYAGVSVSGAGDVDDDGYDDLIVGALYNDDGGSSAGAAYLVRGGATPVSTGLSSASAQYTGEVAGDGAGYSVAAAGDVDADGLDDVILGARDYDGGGDRAGAAYLVLGVASPASHGLSSASVRFTGEGAEDFAGQSVSGAGDVDADGYDDVIIGAYSNDAGGSGAGAAYLVLGGAVPVSQSLSAANARYTGEAAGDEAGFSVSRAGDVDADGYGDVLVAARENDDGGLGAGAAYLVLGRAAPASETLASADAQFAAEAAGDEGGAVSGAGDVDANGYDDILIGVHQNDDGGTSSGAAYLILGTGL